MVYITCEEFYKSVQSYIGDCEAYCSNPSNKHDAEGFRIYTYGRIRHSLDYVRPDYPVN